MRYNIFILILIFLASSLDLKACNGTDYKSRDYLMFRLLPAGTDLTIKNKNQKKENCILWQQQSSSSISLSEIEEVVYAYPLERMDSLWQYSTRNKFAAWLLKEQQALEYLKLAKKGEYLRKEVNSAWYYPSPNNEILIEVRSLIAVAKSYSGTKYKSRYALQVVRLLHLIKENEECIIYWEEVESGLKKDILVEMSLDYVAGANLKLHLISEEEYYAMTGDLESVIFMSWEKGNLNIIEHIFKFDPNSSEIMKLLHKTIRGYENYYYEHSEGYEYGDLNYSRDFLLELGSDARVQNKAAWYYSAAFIEHLQDGNYSRIISLLDKAESYKADKTLKESMEYFRVYLEAKYMRFDSSYEENMLECLKWYDERMRNGLNAEVADRTKNSYDISANRSYYYPGDMMRKVVFDVFIPRFKREGDYVRVMQLANMADHSMYWLAGVQGLQKNVDFSTNLFEMANSGSPELVVDYYNKLLNPSSDLDLFLNARALLLNDYFLDIIGTKYIRKGEYAEAYKYLSKMSSKYQDSLRTADYISYDPFIFDRKKAINVKNYKRNFAKEMSRLEDEMKAEVDPNNKALLMIRYAIGLKNSHVRCWPLAYYFKSTTDWYIPWTEEEATEKSERIIKRALYMFTDDEKAAHANLLLDRYTEIMNKYPQTATADYLRGVCDEWKNY